MVGLTLGVLPLLMAAAEHYDQCFRPFVRYKRIAKEADHFRDQLNIQKTIFRNQCRLLLEEIVEHDAASRMLKGPDDPSWHDAALDAKLSELLGESREACVAAIEIIEQRLHDIQIESQELWTALDAERQVPNPRRNWCILMKLLIQRHHRETLLRKVLGDAVRLRSCGLHFQSQGWIRL